MTEWSELCCRIGSEEVNSKLRSKFSEVLQSLKRKVATEKAQQVHAFLLQNKAQWLPARNEYLCSLLHVAAEEGNERLVRALIGAGAPINIEEGCGMTPLALAVNCKHLSVVKALLQHGASSLPSAHPRVPTPLQIARQLKWHPGEVLLQEEESREEEEDMIIINRLTKVAGKNALVDPQKHAQELELTSKTRKFCIHWGDNKNCQNVRGCRNRAYDVYGNHYEAPGDFHALGYLDETIAKITAPLLYHLIQNIMGRHHVSPTTFDKKFKENNFRNNHEALRDAAQGLGIALTVEFKSSDYFPSERALRQGKERTGSHNEVLLKSFKTYLSARRAHASFRFTSELPCFYGPLSWWYDESIAHGNGISLEAIWMLMGPLFRQAGKTNYRDEAVSHCLSFLGEWPLCVRKMVQQNRTVSVLGHYGHNVASDEWVEGQMVKPIKIFVSMNSTLETVERYAVNVLTLQAIRQMYKSRNAFDVHNTVKYKEPSSWKDKLRVAVFALKEQLFEEGEFPVHEYPYSASSSNGLVKPRFFDSYAKGKEKLLQEFEAVKFRLFPHLYYNLISE